MSALRTYFSVPSSSGFSPYRSGAGVHLVLDVLVGIGVWLLAERVLGQPPLVCGGAVAVAVIGLWGVGWFLGVHSHYNPLITLGAIGTFFVSLHFFHGDIGPGALVGGVVHVVLGAMLKRFNPAP